MKASAPLLLLALATFSFTACTTAARPQSSIAIDTASTSLDWSLLDVGPNDMLSVQVLGHPDLSSPPLGWRVGTRGELDLPLAGEVHVADLSLSEVREGVQRALERFVREPSVTVNVVEYAAREYYVMGQVQKQGAFPLDRPLTAYEAFSRSFGFSSGADRKQVYLLRPHGSELEVIPFNASTPDESGLVAVQPRD
ncbi:MAG: polysaccharide biosynthesis/export family protein, partial [Planctomycetota bacterium]